MPTLAFSQKKKDKKGIQWTSNQDHSKEQVFRKQPIRYQAPTDLAGYHLKKAGSKMLTGITLQLVGGVCLGVAPETGSAESALATFGVVAAVTGLVFQIIGITNITKAGRALNVEGTGISYSF